MPTNTLGPVECKKKASILRGSPRDVIFGANSRQNINLNQLIEGWLRVMFSETSMRLWRALSQ